MGKLSDVQKRDLCRFKLANPQAPNRVVAEFIQAKERVAVGLSTIHDIWKKKDLWLNIPEEHSSCEYTRQRHAPKHEEMERKLFQWFGEVSSKNIPISERMIVNEARHIGKEMDIVGFNYSSGWLSRFKMRYKTKELGYNLDAEITVIKNAGDIPGDTKTKKGIFPVIYNGTKYRTKNVLWIPASSQAPMECSEDEEMKKSHDAEEIKLVDTRVGSCPDVESSTASAHNGTNSTSLIDDPLEDIKPDINLINKTLQETGGDVSQPSSPHPFDLNSVASRKKRSRPVHCEVCGLRLNTKCIYQRHMVIHTGEKPHVCTVCGKGFTQDDTLKTHMNIHTGDRRFLCLVCKKVFAYRTSLHSHMRVHSGEKPFSCKLCEKSFSQQNSRDKHMLIHSGKKPFQCSVCDKTFAVKFYLKCHMRIHTGERPYECQVCHKTFTQGGSLKLHTRTHHKAV